MDVNREMRPNYYPVDHPPLVQEAISLCPNVEKKILQQRGLGIRSLKHFCLQNVINYSKMYLLQDCRVFEKLSGSLRNDLLDFLLLSGYSFRDLSPNDSHKLVSSLVHSRTKSLDFKEWTKEHWSDYDDRLEMALQHISEKAANLQKLKFGREVDVWPNLSSPALDFTRPMIHLQHLSMTDLWYWADKDAENLVHVFPNLKSLTILVGEMTEVGLEYLSRLKQLKEMRFFIKGVELSDVPKATEKFYSLCVQKLPCLKVVGGKTDEYLQQSFCFNPLLLQITPDFNGKFDIQHLHSRYSLPMKASLPHLTNLHFSGPMRKVRTLDTLASYTSLSSLTLSSLRNHELEDILQIVGKRLSELHVEHLEDSLDIFLVLHFCPNLSKFSMYQCFEGMCEIYPWFKSKVGSYNFHCLTEFTATLAGKAPPNLFKFLLQAPNIEKLSLSDILLEQHDFSAIDDLSINELQHLQKFELCYILNDASCLDAVEKICKYVLACAPNISNARVSWFDDEIFEEWCDQKQSLFKAMCYLGGY